MAFRPVKQINTIIRQEYFEPTISWSIRVVLALNIPLIVLPIRKGFSSEVIWAAFGAYMISLIDYKGLHYRKIIIQTTAALLFFCSALLGMNTRETLIAAIAAMFFVGMFAALIRNWSDYGPGIGVATGFFFLYGLSNHVSYNESFTHGYYLLLGAGWAIFITLLTFPFRPSDPLKRSVAKIWKANTDFLDTLIQQLMEKNTDKRTLLNKEMEIRLFIDKSRDLFETATNAKQQQLHHYNQIIGLRRSASLFAAALTAATEDITVFDKKPLHHLKATLLYKTLSAFSQASARIAIVSFSLRDDDLLILKARIKRCDIALELLKKAVIESAGISAADKILTEHFFSKLNRAAEHLRESVTIIEAKLNIENNAYFENYRLSFNNFISGLQPDAVFAFIKNIGKIDLYQLLYALRVSLGLCAGVFIYKYFNIDHGYWIPLTMIIVIQPYYGATLKKALQRISGTTAGIVVGGLIMLLPIPHQVFVGLLFVVSFLVAYFLRNNYKIGVFFVTIMMVIMMQLSHQGSWELIGWRIISTLIGASIAMVSGAILWPVWEKERFRDLAVKALNQNHEYLNKVFEEHYQNSTTTSLARYRRAAETANNELFASLQRMYEEPKRLQKNLDHYFGLTGSSIRITREINSLSLAPKEKNTDYSNWKESLNQLFLQTTAILNGAEHQKNTLVFPSANENSYVETLLEKLAFELSAMANLEAKLPDP